MEHSVMLNLIIDANSQAVDAVARDVRHQEQHVYSEVTEWTKGSVRIFQDRIQLPC